MHFDNHSTTENQPKNKFFEPSPKDKIVAEAKSTHTSKLGESKHMIDPVQEALKILTPAWPLQNTVAVNPFWNMRERLFCDVLSQLTPVMHQQLLMSVQFFREKYAKGTITTEALREALDETRSFWKNIPNSVPELLHLTAVEDHFSRRIETIAEITPHEISLSSFVVDEIGKFAAAYFDQNQALIKFPWKNLSFWEAWLKTQEIDKSMRIVGFSKCNLHLKNVASLKPERAIEKMLLEMGVTSQTGQYLYLKRLAVTVMGWGSQFRYYEWQKNLGYEVPMSPATTELLAVRLAYDYLIYKECFYSQEFLFSQWTESLKSAEIPSAQENESFGILYTWHLALELSYQRQVSTALSNKTPSPKKPQRFKLVFCIDVRSEMIRRHIEAVDNQCGTGGFAGFFATAIDYKKSDEKLIGHRLPVLLTPAIAIADATEADKSKTQTSKHLDHTLITSYFRNLRKLPLSSFVFVELFGIISIGQLLWRVVKSLFLHDELPSRLCSPHAKLDTSHFLNYTSKQPLTLEEKASFAANALKHMGLIDGFAKLNILVGHGAETSNNAFASALDCGACGGHAGDINARFLVSLLNDPEVRKNLEEKSISIPKDSEFIAAIHETVTDEIHLLDVENVSESHKKDIADIKLSLQKASKNCQKERLTARSNYLDGSPKRRSLNWSEVRPEWGLSGNACFVVAPRDRTAQVNLSSRSFLHDYDWKKDEGFKTLELIMTAPMVVTNWINMQYFGSVVAPNYYSSGNKILHNLTNEVGVVEGNGGDLRVGLPIQSIHDGEKFVHEPIRLSVFIEAPRIEIEKVIQKHTVVHDLVVNQWLHILHIDSDTSRIWRRLADGTYTEVLKSVA